MSPAGASESLTAVNPTTGEPLGSVAVTAPAAVQDVVDAVGRVQPLWAQLRLADRAHYMRRAAQAVIDERDELTELLAREQGRPRAEVAVAELLASVEALRWLAQAGPRILGDDSAGVDRALFPLTRVRVAHEPLGVVAVIGATSAPLAQPLGQIATALMAGNGVVLKPAPRACLAGERIERLVARAGLPEGLVRIIHGGADTGAALARSSVAKVLFTGRPPAGAEVARACAEAGHDVVLELGGHDAMLVLDDAPLARAVPAAVWAAFAAAGQARGSLKRVFVETGPADRLRDGIVNGARDLRVGDPLDSRTAVGPLASPARLARVQALVNDAVSRGATLHCGGVAQPAGVSGPFYAPAVLTGVPAEAPLMREPAPGPVLAMSTVKSADEAIARANDCPLGLGVSVWTGDRHQGARIAGELQCAMVWLNDHLIGPSIPQGPWGGVKGSGEGRSLGGAGLHACVRPKLITWEPPVGRAPWWFPYDESLDRAVDAVVQLRSVRDSDRQRGLRQGLLPLARVLARNRRAGRG